MVIGGTVYQKGGVGMDKEGLTVSINGGWGKPEATTWAGLPKADETEKGQDTFFEIDNLENIFANQFKQHILYIFGNCT